MKIKAFLSMLALGAVAALATPPDVGFFVDLAHPDRKFEWTTFVGNTPSVPVQILTNGAAYIGFTGYTPELNYFPNDASSAGKTISGTLSGSIATFKALTNSFPAKGDYFGEVFMTLGGDKITCGQGVIKVQRSPSSGSYGDLNLSPRVNWDIVVNVGTVPWSLLTEPIFLASVAYNITSAMTNQWSVAYTNYGPRITSNEINIAVLTTGKTDLVTYTAHVAAQANTNTEYEIRIVSNEIFRITTQPATNTALQLQITTNLVAQGNTNIEFELRIDSNETFRITTQPATNISLQDQITLNLTNQNATNTLTQTQITLNLTNQNATNAVFRDLFIAQENTNSAFQGLFNSQFSTNSVFQGLFNVQADTNAGFQSLHAAQGNTNTGFESRIASNEIFRITTQPATNTALQLQITNNLAMQTATNLNLQNQITGNLTNQNATNAALQAGIDSVGTGTWSLAVLTDGSRPANYLKIVNTNYLGANIVTNGTFTGSAANWSLSAFYYSGNRVILNPNLTGSIEYTNTLIVTTSKMYQLIVKTTYAGAAVTASVGGVTSTWTSVNGAIRTEYFYAINNDKIIISAGTGANALELDDITLKECPTGSIFVAQDVNAGNIVRARVSVEAPNITVISNNAKIATGGTFSGPVTNTYGYYGDGGGLTNVTSSTTNVMAHNQNWSTITSTPTSLAGYGITNAIGDNMTRYYARTNANETVQVLASDAGITVTRTNELFNFSIPVGVEIFSANLEIDGGETDSGVIRLAMGTNDMPQGAIATMWIPSANGWNKTSYSFVTLVPRPDPDNLLLIKVSGFGTQAGTIFGFHLVW